MRRKRGKLIVLEGIDGAGKTSIAEVMKSHPKLQDPVVVKNIDEESITGKAIRAIMADGKNHVISHARIAMLYLSELLYVLHKDGGVADILSSGRDVIMDRYYFSTIAYAPTEFVANAVMELLALNNKDLIIPDLSIYVKVDVGVAMERLTKDREQLEHYETSNKLSAISNKYEDIVNDYKLITYDNSGDLDVYAIGELINNNM